VIVDTSALLAYFDTAEPDHQAVAHTINTSDEPLVVSPYVVAELDYLVATRIGVDAELAALDELAAGAWDLPAIGTTELRQAAAIIRKYRDHHIGVTDASNVILAAQHHTRTVCTLDHRHFTVLRPLTGGRFTLVPALSR
jgi:predicted nucleic acid-binding protein